MQVEAILAIATNGVIGNRNSLPWRLADDLQYFKQVTSGHAVVMGRKTHQSIGRALPQRVNLVLTTGHDKLAEGVIPVGSVYHAIEATEQLGAEKLFVIGGPSLWMAFGDYLTQVHLTRVHGTPEGDTRFIIPYHWYSWEYELAGKLKKENSRNEYPFETWLLTRPN